MVVKKKTKAATGNEAKQIFKEAKTGFSKYEKQHARSMKKIQEAYPMASANREDEGWRSLTSNTSGRDLNSVTQDKMREIAFFLWDSNPMGHRIVEIMSDFVVGDGFSFQAEDKKVHEVLENFWYDPENNLDEAQGIDVMELSLFGELCLPVWVNQANGHVKLGYLDASRIKKVTKYPKNPRLKGHVHYTMPSKPGDIRKMKVVNVDKALSSKTYGRLVGECFFFTINKVWNTTRGRSDLLPLADWLDGHDQYLFARLERAFLLNNFIWDITATGMTKPELQEFVKTIGMPKPGSIRAHNEKVTWSTVSPNLESADASQEARLFKNQILGGAGFPEHWFAEGASTTRATALEMSLPTLKRLRGRQKQVKFMYQQILNFVIDQAIIAGTLKEGVNRKFNVNGDPIISRDNKGMAIAVKNFTEGLSLAEEKNWITTEEAQKSFKLLMTQCGADFGKITLNIKTEKDKKETEGNNDEAE